MSHMNLNFSLISYEDSSVTNPTVRSLDISRSLVGIPVSGERTDRVENLSAGESKVIASTLRPITQDSSTVYSIVHPRASDYSVVRLQWNGVGTAPSFATKRAIGISAFTSIAITRLNAATCRISSSNVIMNTTTVQVGDLVKFEKSTDSFTSLFPVNSQNTFRIISKGAGYVDVTENGLMSDATGIVLGSSFDMQMRIFSNGSVKVNDILDISGSSQNPNNAGKFQILDVSPDYVQFVNPFAADVSFAVGTDTVQVYDRLIGFVFIRATASVSLKVNGGAAIKIQNLCGNEALFMGSVQAFQLEILNEEQTPVSVTAYYSSIM